MKSKIALLSLLLIVILATSCSRDSGLPETGSPQYVDFCRAFYTGLAGLQVGEDVRALEELTRSTKLVPGEPAGWADLGILQLRQQQLEAAFSSVEKARSLSPNNSRIEALLGAIESKRGRVAEALAHLKKAVALDGRNFKAVYSLVDEIDRQALPGSELESEKLLGQILAAQPTNIEVLLSAARLAAKRGDSVALRHAMDTLRPLEGNWPDPARQQVSGIEHVAASDPKAAAVQVIFLRNLLTRVPAYRQSLNQVKVPATYVAEPFTQLLRLPSANSQPAAPDISLRFESQPLAGASPTVTWVGVVSLSEKSDPASVWADATSLHITGGATLPLPGPAGAQLARNAIASADLNYDFKTDLIVATPSGLRIYQQMGPQHFKDVTADSKIPPSIVRGNYTGVWAFDFDLDGDLDIVLGMPQGEPLVLRNNGDGSFLPVHPFQGVDGMSAFSTADIDGDGDPDVALIDKAGKLILFRNDRLGSYRRFGIPAELNGTNLDVAAADINGDGRMDFILLRSDFSVLRLSEKDGGAGFDFAEVARANPSSSSNLTIADLDNNGALDLIIGDQVLLGDGTKFTPLPAAPIASVTAAVDLNQDGRLDLVGLHAGQAVTLTNHGSKNYHWQLIRTRAARTVGDQRINSFGLGGEIEIRSDLLTQKQITNAPLLHFGLGEHTKVDFARIVWPNGSVQAEFALSPDTTVLAVQRLKGSCPFLFTWNGQQFQFVKDTAPWSPALGLHINGQQVAGIYQTQEWFKIPGNELTPRDGSYELRVTGEYWETFYIDHYSLLVVDHPVGTQVFTDERFAVPPPALKLYVTKDPKPFARATDSLGQDVSALVQDLDSRYLDTFGRGQYQGVTSDHWVELELPSDSPTRGPLYLIAQGWMHPTDATINVALGQNAGPQPQGLSIEIPDRHGHWVVARKGLGFPAGRRKTLVFDLTGLPRKFRLRTNLEIYWDQLQWAAGVPDQAARTRHLDLSAAELRYRGFSQISQANISSPEVPNYNVLAETGQKWRDMEGYYTRFGDVRELLQKIDDRMVIMNAGDELRLKFAAQSEVAAGYSRDYVMVGDGWIKDGDYNSSFSETVLPLPFHGMKAYSTPPRTLEEDPAFRLHPSDWQNFHTRYVTPKYFLSALWEPMRGNKN